jgi:hypothetical protein
MTSEWDADQKHLRAALDHAVAGNRPAALAELKRIWSKSMEHMYRLWQALAETAVYPHRPKDREAVYALKVFDGHGPADIDKAEPAARIAMRFLVAQANRDKDTRQALFLTALNSAPAVTADALVMLLDAATESARAQLAAHQDRQASETFRRN